MAGTKLVTCSTLNTAFFQDSLGTWGRQIRCGSGNLYSQPEVTCKHWWLGLCIAVIADGFNGHRQELP